MPTIWLGLGHFVLFIRRAGQSLCQIHGKVPKYCCWPLWQLCKVDAVIPVSHQRKERPREIGLWAYSCAGIHDGPALRTDPCGIKDKTEPLYMLVGHFLNQISNPDRSYPGSCLEMLAVISISVTTPLEPVSAQFLPGIVLRVCRCSQLQGKLS